MLEEVNDDVVDEEEDGLSAEAGRELTSTAESGVSERFSFVVTQLFSDCVEVDVVWPGEVFVEFKD